ncbi:MULTISPECIES: hypothetical protein [unclassified Mesorhizobium]|uniref:hypothetical protein n=1 Tax=unclassified Mesorhizobium TaxID=325217 RepID=UPI000FE6A5C7|nr:MULTISPECIES: hypothetical protein [unclassified Mesorhizobium]RWC95638.1 MAG: hypothetical protein EOS32_11940 [Mesorhizobium sp.]TGV25983.1 hypothetical protein EN786_10535 [Mesorhizobium sp. M4B.F.Ca.ET.143.01.1.1]
MVNLTPNIGKDDGTGKDERSGKFLPGHKGFKKVGSRSKVSRQAIDMANEHAVTAMNMLVGAMMGGDLKAAEILLKYGVDAFLPKSRTVELPDVPENPTSEELAKTVLQAAWAGEISPDEAKQLLEAITASKNIVEDADLLRRVERLEVTKRG